jgi:hypothetical protein
MPLEPVARGITIDSSLVDGLAGTSTLEYPLGAIGVAVDGVAIYSGLAAPGDRIDTEQYTFDDYEAHPDNRGSYHYHTATPGPLEALAHAGLVTHTTPGAAELEIYGVLCDGTVVLGCTELDGSAPRTDDLDAQNGHVHDLVDRAGTVELRARYHTHVCPARLPGDRYTPEIMYYGTCTRR